MTEIDPDKMDMQCAGRIEITSWQEKQILKNNEKKTIHVQNSVWSSNRLA